MSAIFISHSSLDNVVAGAVNAELARRGHRSVFLDFDPALGIPAGRNWEQELYARLRGCQAVIVLCSAHSMASPWCFAEITHARALGKHIFPVRIGDGVISPLLGDLQLTDLTQNPAEAFQRLATGLKRVGLDPAGLFDWDGSRPPYPGLLAFQKQDAAIYFGRHTAIQSGIETLNRLQRLGGARLVLVLGASGSGKSSLMRAGILPRLERDRDQWLVIEPFRPLSQPFDQLAMVLAAAFGEGRDWKPIRDILTATADNADAAGLPDLVNDLRSSANRREASLLLVVDQFEELLGGAAGGDAERFLRLLNHIASSTTGALVVVGTLRSDFLNVFQTQPALQGLGYEPILLPQILLSELAQVIEGPARVAGLELEPGLVQAMVDDTATDDALPLLAFTLRELWQRYGEGGRLLLEHYREGLGGLQGSLARAAEAVVAEGSVSDHDVQQLRKAFLRLVRVDDEGRYLRQARPWTELPADTHALLERFVKARLLVSSSDGAQRTLEVAHEALFRSWVRLAAWLNADREFLLWRQRLRGDLAEWRRNQRDESLGLRGPVLVEAQRWLAERADDLDDEERDFIGTSVATRDREQAARDRRRRRVIGASAAAAMFFLVLSALATWQWNQANEQRDQANQQRRLALARQLNVQADAAGGRDDPVRSLLLTVQSMRNAWTVEGQHALVERLDSIARAMPSSWRPHPGPVRALALSPDRRWLASAGQGALQVQSASGEVVDLKSRNGHHYIHALAFSPGGEWLAAACDDQTVCIYDTRTWQLSTQLPRVNGVISALSFSPDGKVLASAAYNAPTVHIHAVPGWEEQQPITIDDQGVRALAFSPDGHRIAMAGSTVIELWQFAERERRSSSKTPGCWSLAFSPDGVWLAAGGDRQLTLLQISAGDDGALQLKADAETAIVKTSLFSRVAFSRDGRYVAISDQGAGVRVANVNGGHRNVSLTPSPAGAVLFSADRSALSGNLDGTITQSDPDAQAAHRIEHEGPVLAVALSADRRWLASASDGGLLRIFDAGSGKELRTLRQATEEQGLAFSPDGRWLSSVDGKNLWLIDTTSWQVTGPFEHEDRVTTIAFGPYGKLATTTDWDSDGAGRYGIKRPSRKRIWDIATQRELAWMFDIEGDRKAAMNTHKSRESLDAINVTAGGDAELAAQAASWPPVRTGRPGARKPELIVPNTEWLTAQTAQGTKLSEGVLQRAQRAHGSKVETFAFSADGGLLASAHERDLRLWHLKSDDLALDACARLPRNLSCEEWRDTFGGLPYAKTCPQLPEPSDIATCRASGKVAKN